MKVLLSTSPHVRHPAVLECDFQPEPDVMYTFAPVGLLSLFATLRADKPEVERELYDINKRIISGELPLDGGIYRDIAVEICAAAPDLVGFMTECDSYHHILQIAREIKNLEPDLHIVLGGPHASAVARPTLERFPCVDGIVIGEGEVTFLEIVENIARHGSFTRAIPGAVVRGSDGNIWTGPARALVKTLDDLAIPAYDMYQARPGEEIFLEVGRGCPFQCTFCSTAPYWHRRHRVKSPARILQEINLVRSLYGSTRVHFTHDLFTTHRAWVREVCNILIEADVPIQWTCSARTDTVDHDLLSLMAASGCNGIYFGVESGSERILSEIKKGIPLNHSFSVLRDCIDCGIAANAGFIVGFPTEDDQSLQDTFAAYEHSVRLGCRPVHLFTYCPFAESALYSDLSVTATRKSYVDWPLGRAVDLQNRRMVDADPLLFGSYQRPDHPGLSTHIQQAMDALDEFSPLVESCLAPTLGLAARRPRGIYDVFGEWAAWIQSRNDTRGAEPYRLGYGSPLDYATFVLEKLMADSEEDGGVLAAATALHANQKVSQVVRAQVPITMGTYRSVRSPLIDAAAPTLGTRLSCCEVVETLSLDYDVLPALNGEPQTKFEQSPMYLVWQVRPDGTVRLLRTDAFIFQAIRAVAAAPLTIGELLIDHVVRSGASVDAQTKIQSLTNAVAEGLVAYD